MIFFDTLANLGASGYGGSAQKILFAMSKQGVNVRSHLIPGEIPDVHLFYGQLYNESIDNERTIPYRGGRLVFYTMFESNVMPQEWIDNIEKYKPELIIAASKWCAESFRKYVPEHIPIETVPLGIDHTEFFPLRREFRAAKQFTYLWQGFTDNFDRKGGNLVEKAFDDLVDNGELPGDDVRLIKKSTPHVLRGVSRDVRWDTDDNALNFLPIKRDILMIKPLREMHEIYRQADVSVNPTGGEGFGLIPLEHMATGLPIIAPCATGMKDYLDGADGLYIPLRCHLMKSLVGPGMIDRPLYDGVREAMLYAYRHRDELKVMGKNAGEYAKQFTYDESVIRMATILAKHFGEEAVMS